MPELEDVAECHRLLNAAAVEGNHGSGAKLAGRVTVLLKKLFEWKQAAGVEAGLRREFSNENDKLTDALQGCLDWIEENCEGPAYPYCVTEGRAALKGISIVRRAPAPTGDDRS